MERASFLCACRPSVDMDTLKMVTDHTHTKDSSFHCECPLLPSSVRLALCLAVCASLCLSVFCMSAFCLALWGCATGHWDIGPPVFFIVYI